MSKKSPSKFNSTGEALCCCEYENWKGQRSHILACCCDCEAVDETFDRLFKCERVPSSTIDRMLTTISDRLRIPLCFGGGALKVQPDVLIPAVVVPTCLCMATLHPVMTVLSFLFMPVAMGIFLALFRRHDPKRRTVFFYSWALTSIITCYLVFQVFVVAYREVLLWEILLVFTLTATILRLLFRVRRDAGRLKETSTKPGPGHKRTHSNLKPSVDNGMLYDQVTGKELSSDHQFYNSNSTPLPDGKSVDGSVQWLDSRSNEEMSRHDTYCDECRMRKPPRAGHCPRCQVCISVRDHHCVWIDSCVGSSNHRHFVAAMFVFVVTGLYGVHLTMTTICTPVMIFDWFLLPNDCRWLYIDFLTSICFVTAIYTSIVSCLVGLGLCLQLILISQNITGQELVKASREGLTRCILLAPQDHPYNKGFFQNWAEFLFLESRSSSFSELPL